MQRQLALAVVLFIIAAGSWVYVTRPAVPPAPTPPAPQRQLTQGKATSAALAMASNADKPDPPSKQDLKQLAVKIAKLKKSQRVVNGMVQIKPGQSGVVALTSQGNIGVSDAWGISLAGSTVAGTLAPNGWSFGGGTSNALISVPDDATAGVYTAVLDTNFNGMSADQYTGTFTVTGPLTGSVAVNAITKNSDNNVVGVALKADTTSDLELVSAVIDWGDGSGTETISLSGSSWTGTSSHVYTTEDTFTITVTYTDNASPTPNTVAPTATVTTCFPSTEDLAGYADIFDTSGPFQISISKLSSVEDETTGIWTNTYKVGIKPGPDKPFITFATQSGFFYDGTWALPDGATTTDSINSVGPITFSLPASSASDALEGQQVTYHAKYEDLSCDVDIGTGFWNLTAAIPMAGPPSNGWWLFL